MRSPYRLVATDLDGTTVRSDRTISDRTVAALARVERAGATVVFVTGRPPRWMGDVAQATGHHGIAVCANGAVVYDLYREEILETRPVERAAVEELVHLLRAALPDVGFAAERADAFVRESAYRHSRGARMPKESSTVPTAEIVAEPAVKLLAWHPDLDADTLLAKGREVVGDLAELTHSSDHGLLEISARGVSKASTLARICERRGVDPAQVLAFGDMPNDLPLLAWAGRTYAVANAHPTVLEAVERHAPSNDDDGVARVLESLFSGRE